MASSGGWPGPSNPPHPPLLSGSVSSGVGNLLSGVMGPPVIPSGYVPAAPFCCKCGVEMGRDLRRVIVVEPPVGSSGIGNIDRIQKWWCYSCAGFEQDRGFTGNRLKWTIEGSPFTGDVPLPILHDWLEENQKDEAADFIKGLMNGGTQ